MGGKTEKFGKILGILSDTKNFVSKSFFTCMN